MPASFIEPAKATEVKFTSCYMIVVQLLCFLVVLVLIMSIFIFFAELFVTYCAVLFKCYCRVFLEKFSGLTTVCCVCRLLIHMLHATNVFAYNVFVLINYAFSSCVLLLLIGLFKVNLNWCVLGLIKICK